MATRTFPFASFGDGSVYAELDVNDANWRVTRGRVVNPSAFPLKVIVYENGVAIYSAIAPAGRTTQWNLNPFRLGWDSVDGGLILGPYEFGTQYPAEV